LAEQCARIYDRVAMKRSRIALQSHGARVPTPACTPWWTTGVCLAALGLFGCSSGLEGVEKRLSTMQDEITRLQNQNDRLVERVDAIEVSDAKAARSGKPTPAASNNERPSLKVVKVVPEDTSGMPSSPQVGTPAPGEAADDPSPRPVIKVRGGGTKSETGRDGRGES
jgi:hypothetical protein